MLSTFLVSIKTFLAELNIELTLNYKTICFGKMVNIKKDILVNFIIISAKYFIFKSKYLKIIPNITGYKRFLYKRIEIEKCIAFEKDKLDQHIIKWSPFINSVSTT